MPTYEYVCENCGSEFQQFVKTMNAPVPACEQCGSEKVTRKLSVFGVSAAKAPERGAGCQSCPSGQSCPMAGRM